MPSSSKEQIPKGRGTTGPVEVGYFSYISSASKAFIKSALSVGIPSTNDFNGDSGSIGVNRMSRLCLSVSALTSDTHLQSLISINVAPESHPKLHI